MSRDGEPSASQGSAFHFQATMTVRESFLLLLSLHLSSLLQFEEVTGIQTSHL